MTTKEVTTNRTAYLVIALLVIIIAFLLLGGLPWMKGLMHRGSTVNMASWNWLQIFIGLSVGFLLGIMVGRRKW